jgi:hypothetical protein
MLAAGLGVASHGAPDARCRAWTQAGDVVWCREAWGVVSRGRREATERCADVACGRGVQDSQGVDAEGSGNGVQSAGSGSEVDQ